jgi:hypothetical protein
MNGWAWSRARRGAVAGGLLVLATLASACTYGPDPAITFVQIADGAEKAGNVAWFCQSSGGGGHHGDTGGGLADTHYAGKTKGVLTRQECHDVAVFFDKAMATAKRFPTRGVAKQWKNRQGAPGFIQSVQFVPGLGTHDLIADVSLSGFNPERPMFFQYDGNGDDARLAGLSWFVQQPEGVTAPPEGFPGGNDMWHTHATLCYRNGVGGVVVGSEISDEECIRRGGHNEGLPRVWMIHAWIMPGYENTYDVFSGAYACVRGKGPVTDPDDACKGDHREMEHGNPAPTTTVLPPTTSPTTSPTTGPTIPGSPTTAPPSTVATTPTTMPPVDHGNHDH